MVKRIALIVPSLRQAGPVTVAHSIAVAATDSGFECEVCYFDDMPHGVPLHDFPCLTKRISDITPDYLDRFDVVHSHGLRPAIFTGRNRHKFHGRTVTTMHNRVFADYCMAYGRLRGSAGACAHIAAARRHERVTCVSPDLVRYYSRSGISRKAIAYTPNCMRPHTGRRNPPSQEMRSKIMALKGDGILIGSVAVLVRRKRIDTVLRALALLPPHYRLVVVGDGPERQALERLAGTLGVDRRVLFAGELADADLYMDLFDMTVLASAVEGFPLVLLEAAETGCPVILSDSKIFDDIVPETVAPRFRYGSQESLAGAIRTTTRDCGLRLSGFCRQIYPSDRLFASYLPIYMP